MNPQILNRFLESGDRLEVAGVVLNQQVVKRIGRVCGELEGVILALAIGRDSQTELVLQLLARPQNVAQPIDHDFQDHAEVRGKFRRNRHPLDSRGCQQRRKIELSGSGGGRRTSSGYRR